MASSPDGRYLATAQETPAIHLWDVLAGLDAARASDVTRNLSASRGTPSR